ncbi:hypothetical protein K443DRAFT_397190 [Laccaria amethystina LaAM-08-1]|uniref:Uncharacterized protein n=1 Tax=Laccaria amethystina LaAM-08-1 TaxID=1095629 RepID=A0A0C9WQK0_9AGAR|nr:hypothetical protein K443DRAFT_397190 [Laccaria amethystina LaAM-08-1]
MIMAVSASYHSALLTSPLFYHLSFLFSSDSCRLATIRSFNQLFFRVSVLIMVSSPLIDLSYRISDSPLRGRFLFHLRSHSSSFHIHLHSNQLYR